MTTGTESGRERDKRHYQRALFDGIAERYEVSRPGYPVNVVEFVTSTAGLGPRAAVLEVGCGTGQLTERLACSGLQLTAIDIGVSMIAAARRRLAGAGVCFEVTSFEDLAAAGASFDLVISGAAFHWIEPASPPWKAPERPSWAGRTRPSAISPTNSAVSLTRRLQCT